jgi:quinol monooxygenase YgiN
VVRHAARANQHAVNRSGRRRESCHRGKDSTEGGLMYSYIWEYIVHPEFKAEFEAAYGVDGEWAQLFRHEPAYIRTDLLRDRENPLRFMTIDYWKSREEYLSFQEKYRSDFAAIDTRCETLTSNEIHLGEFDLLD